MEEEEIVRQPSEFPALTASRRTKICLWIIVIGLLNFLAYTLVYLDLGGDAMNGYAEHNRLTHVTHYFLLSKGINLMEVSRGVWIYSAIHAISIWITVGAVLLSMLTLAKDSIVSSMRSSIVRGRTLITILATIVVLISVSVTVWFLIHMIQQLASPRVVPPLSPPPQVMPLT